LLDLLDLYTHNRANTAVGTEFPLEAFLTIRIPLNQEADSKNLPRFTHWKDLKSSVSNGSKHNKQSTPNKGKEKDVDIRPANPLTPVSATDEKPLIHERGRDGTVRFMLDPERAEDEKKVVSGYFKDEVEEYVED
jgi:CTD kinase subunit beta